MFTKFFLSNSNPTPPVSIFFSGSGGIESTIGNKKIHRFDGPNGTFYVHRTGSYVISGNNAETLIVAGGGGGGKDHGGGGGGGAVIYFTAKDPVINPYLVGTTYGITVGVGGTGGPFQGFNGGNSSITSSIIS